MDGQSAAQASAIVRSSGHDPAAISELAALIEQALAVSDASGLVFVSIDLCSALARLRAMGAPARSQAVSGRQ